MGRIQDRANRMFEKNPIAECNKIRTRFLPGLFDEFAKTKDPRNLSYVKYSNSVMLGTLFYKGIAGLKSMHSMNYEFNQEDVTKNIYGFLNEKSKEYLPHSVTMNEYMEELDYSELEETQARQVYSLIRRKTFDDARFQRKWLVIVDGTQLYSGSRKLNENCLERHYKNDIGIEIVNYHCDVLEAKIVLGESLIVSIASEFIENNGEDAERQQGMSEAEKKQDCETKAFIRLAAKLKERFPRLPIIILADSLYASEPVMNLCRSNNWDFIIRYKTGSIPSLAEEYELIPGKERVGRAEFVNELDYRGNKVNMLRFWEDKVTGGEIERTTFQWLTSIKLTKSNAEKTAAAGRKRWKIENEGFNRQKNWQGDITHACSHNANAMKNHYLMTQISDMVKQLYEWFFLKKNGIVKTQKNISSELLASFAWQPISTEDIQTRQPEKALC